MKLQSPLGALQSAFLPHYWPILAPFFSLLTFPRDLRRLSTATSAANLYSRLPVGHGHRGHARPPPLPADPCSSRSTARPGRRGYSRRGGRRRRTLLLFFRITESFFSSAAEQADGEDGEAREDGEECGDMIHCFPRFYPNKTDARERCNITHLG